MSGSGQKEQNKGNLKWWQLSLLGVASTIGTGYFLGSGLGISMAGPSILIAFALAALGTYTVFEALARMTAKRPEKGSFRSYAKQAYGRWAGFSSGWVYWSSELLIMGSQLTALSLFSRFWFPGVPMWLFATGYALLGLIVILIGNKGFDSVENVLSVIKIAAILLFLGMAGAALFGWIPGGGNLSFPRTIKQFFPSGVMGLWSGLIFAFYAFGGIEVMGMMAFRLKDPKEAPKAGKIMLLLLATVYILSIGLVVTLVSWKAVVPKKSPFITALDGVNMPFIPHLFNSVLIIAGFSTMVASLYAVTTMLVTLAEDRDAPTLFAKKALKKRPMFAIGLTAAGLTGSIILSLAMPGRIYEYITTAAGLLLLYNWLFILLTSGKLLKLTMFGKVKRIAGMALILLAVSGTLTHATSRPGFWGSLGFVGVIGSVTLLMQFKVWKKRRSGAKRRKAVLVRRPRLD
ncbi:amino acid/polyamine/organocation transporter (APC superfamily) [Fontibacillus phaseoli]|uniref:Amino acid/polyamine/organocation transporter (APC superfamily) n=1 Tax=Fontibacillus phaseoli TaxID=1416533 RepID=A0A369AX69_9BACL|nr:amino acid permease [Fontibacillus phaseoli]RCX12816.1 amino acid/polyamine/organocation transporter (APC superfamily) [Fontibacillus phaseoli]